MVTGDRETPCTYVGQANAKKNKRKKMHTTVRWGAFDPPLKGGWRRWGQLDDGPRQYVTPLFYFLLVKSQLQKARKKQCEAQNNG